MENLGTKNLPSQLQGMPPSLGHPDGVDQFGLMGNTALLTELQLLGDCYSPRWGLAAASVDDKVYIFGGYIWYHGAERFHDDFYEIDPQTLTIRRLVTSGPTPSHRFGHSIVADPQNQALILFGGRSSVASFNDVWSFSTVDHTWTLISGSSTTADAPSPRNWHTANFHKGSMYIVGGWSGFGEVFGEVWRFDLAKLTWECLCPGAQKSSSKPSSGLDSQSATAVPPSPASRKTSDVSQSTLTEIFGLEGRTCHQAVIWRESLYIYGGVINNNFVASDELWRFDLYTREWYYVPTVGAGPGKKVSPAGALCGDNWILHGGLSTYPGIGVPVSDVHQFDFTTSTWHRKTEVSLISGVSSPGSIAGTDLKQLDRFKIARYGHCGVMSTYGHCPMFFGGADAYASAQSNLAWRIEIIPSVTQIGRLLNRKIVDDEERRKLLRDVSRLQEESRIQSNRIVLYEEQIAYWRTRSEEANSLLEILNEKVQNLERQVAQLSTNVKHDVEPVVKAVHGFAMSLVENMPPARSRSAASWKSRE
eukprot:Blabericola_migrator_1__6542@NODE_32_length_18281_cov_109_908422_g28_i0_p4_GENE_NODE_32_length_18281_cov_109_908422_g28_i0NODE_32_length_18281_cov_109_908422_g28_i0_p4_ORF_typecomplete_len534_score58_96Kelch_3/PF13415_6/2_6e02Kelch_3/PF13415_6/3_1e10Kelch_3/PF13415_6/1_7e10Kelch_3/PF13415_6/4_8e07Kelch_3/PF13415_6/6_1e03Kelch_3/PF13415_6/0_0037Kelch_3/PF13415_6/0_002Kelch_3/PF13415_6/2_2e03Kelch_4/PF13418_6/6_5e06Kelch_4/PF13418_6/8e10Kelch_4/PF13418_6/2_1e09Kelch_4/PF13418_6/1_5e07Kelch_4/PF134